MKVTNKLTNRSYLLAIKYPVFVITKTVCSIWSINEQFYVFTNANGKQIR